MVCFTFAFYIRIRSIIDVPARALHLGFGLFLVFLLFPFYKKNRSKKINILNFLLSITGFLVTFFLFYYYEALVYRNGVLLKQQISLFGNIFVFPTELIIGIIGILLLLEATRRAIGIPLVIVASIFLIYSFFGQSMPELISHQGLSQISMSVKMK